MNELRRAFQHFLRTGHFPHWVVMEVSADRPERYRICDVCVKGGRKNRISSPFTMRQLAWQGHRA